MLNVNLLFTGINMLLSSIYHTWLKHQGIEKKNNQPKPENFSMMVQMRENKLQWWPPLDATGALNIGWFPAKVPSELTNPSPPTGT